MALTIAKYTTPDPLLRLGRGDVVLWVGKITFDNSYPTGGEAVAASDFDLDSIIFLAPAGLSNVATKLVLADQANSKLLIYVEDAISGIQAQASNASDQSAVSVDIMVIGRKASA